jgi:hypothetical protein
LLMFSAYTVHAGLNFSLLESFVVRVLWKKKLVHCMLSS